MFVNNRQYWTNRQLGTFYSYWLPGTPVDGHFRADTSGYVGEMPVHQTNPRSTKGHYKRGGPWSMWKRTAKRFGEFNETYSASYYLAYRGYYVLTLGLTDNLLAGSGLTDRVGTASQSGTYMQSLELSGAEALAKMKPTLPDFSLGVSLYELKDIPKMIESAVFDVRKNMIHRRNQLGNHKKWYTKSGEYYLALQFGWLPLLGDIVNFYSAFKGSSKRFNQLLRDEGRPVRRGRGLPDWKLDLTWNTSTTDNNAYGHSLVFPKHVTNCYSAGNTVAVSGKLERSAWCAGQCRYFLPRGPRNAGWSKIMIRRIMGGSITPVSMWKVMPWSWLAGYFTSLGYVLENLSNTLGERLIWDYAYVMCHTKVTRSETVTIRLRSKSSTVGANSWRPVAVKSIRTSEHKLRVAANPFGFGIKSGNLSPFQFSILGALGLSRL